MAETPATWSAESVLLFSSEEKQGGIADMAIEDMAIEDMARVSGISNRHACACRSFDG